MKIGIVGTGIGGLTCAHYLHGEHDITVFEANDYAGGHSHTVDVDMAGETYPVDTGFVVYTPDNYPGFQHILDDIGVKTQPTTMGFSYRNDARDLEYSGSGLNELFAQRRNLVRPSYYRLLYDVVRFYRMAPELIESSSRDMTLGEFFERESFSTLFEECHLLPMGAAIWSCTLDQIREFPLVPFLRFYQQRGLLNLWQRPQWYSIQGGSRQYVERMIQPFENRIRLGTPVHRVRRNEPTVTVEHSRGTDRFDTVIMATHSDQALKLLENPRPIEREILGNMPYKQNQVTLHTDTSLLPRRQRAWSSWNFHVFNDRSDEVTLTYNMNELQRIEAPVTYCVTLNQGEHVDESRVIHRFQYGHPVFTRDSFRAKRRHHEINGLDGIYYSGAYWGYGFHEDGVQSALRVLRALKSPTREKVHVG